MRAPVCLKTETLHVFCVLFAIAWNAAREHVRVTCLTAIMSIIIECAAQKACARTCCARGMCLFSVGSLWMCARRVFAFQCHVSAADRSEESLIRNAQECPNCTEFDVWRLICLGALPIFPYDDCTFCDFVSLAFEVRRTRASARRAWLQRTRGFFNVGVIMCRCGNQSLQMRADCAAHYRFLRCAAIDPTEIGDRDKQSQHTHTHVLVDERSRSRTWTIAFARQSICKAANKLQQISRSALVSFFRVRSNITRARLHLLSIRYVLYEYVWVKVLCFRYNHRK